jgi:hypothetical protein
MTQEVLRLLLADALLFFAGAFAAVSLILEIGIRLPAHARTVSVMSRWTAAAMILTAAVLIVV